MITAIADWVRNVILIVLFASFVEMLLPNSSMQRFVRVVLGIFVMLAVLNPVVDFVQNWRELEQVPAISMQTNSSVDYQQKDDLLLKERERLAREIYRQDLAKQIRALVIATDGVAEAKVVVETSEQGIAKYSGQISHINVAIQPGKPSGHIQKIQIGSTADNNQTYLDQKLVSKIKQRIAELYQIDVAKIAIERME